MKTGDRVFPEFLGCCLAGAHFYRPNFIQCCLFQKISKMLLKYLFLMHKIQMKISLLDISIDGCSFLTLRGKSRQSIVKEVQRVLAIRGFVFRGFAIRGFLKP